MMNYLRVFLLSTLLSFNAFSYNSNHNIEKQRNKWVRDSGERIISKFQCPGLIEPIKNFHAESIYCQDDKTRSIVCPENKAIYEKEIKQVNDFISTLGLISKRYLSTMNPSKKILNCFLDHVYHWGVNQALQSYPQPSHQGEYVRFTTLAKVSEHWLVFQDENLMDKRDIRVKRAHYWFSQMAKNTIRHFKYRAGDNAKIGNHRYWGGLAVLNTAIIRNDKNLFEWGKKSFMIGINEIELDGSLPVELKRGKRGLSYHFYALAPLIAMENKLSANGYTSLKIRNKLTRLVNFAHGNYYGYEKSLKVSNEMKKYVSECSSAVPPLEIYLKRYARTSRNANSPLHAQIIKDARQRCSRENKLYYSGIGGQLTTLFGLVNLDPVIAPKINSLKMRKLIYNQRAKALID